MTEAHAALLEKLQSLEDDAIWRRQWHTRLGRRSNETEGRFYERIEVALAAETVPPRKPCEHDYQPIPNNYYYRRCSKCGWESGVS